jgi:hypothetical protein
MIRVLAPLAVRRLIATSAVTAIAAMLAACHGTYSYSYADPCPTPVYAAPPPCPPPPAYICPPHHHHHHPRW